MLDKIRSNPSATIAFCFLLNSFFYIYTLKQSYHETNDPYFPGFNAGLVRPFGLRG